CAVEEPTEEKVDTKQNEMDEMDQVASELGTSNLVRHSDEDGKEETVYVIMNADGVNESTIVSEWLKNPQGEQNLKDNSNLEEIEVVKGNATLTSNSEGNLEWNTSGEDVYYRGTTKKELPVSMNVNCKLDGKSMKASELKDVTGHIEIDYKYINRMYKNVDIDGNTHAIYQPFTTITGLLFDNNQVSNIKVTNGKVIDSGASSVVFGIALPGLKESLGLDDFDQDITIPESITIEADVVNFTMPMAITVVSNTALSALNLDDIESVDELKDKMNQLSDGMNQLMDGSVKLSDGMNALASGTQSLSDGVAQLDNGAGQLDAGAKQLLSGAGELKSGAGQLYDGATSLQGGAQQLAGGLQALNDKAPALAAGVESIKNGADSLNAGLGQLTANNDSLNGGATQVASGLAALSNGVDQMGTTVNTCATNAAGAIMLLNNLKTGDPTGDAQLDGVIALLNGYSALDVTINGDGTATNPGMANSVKALSAGADSLKTGVEQYTGGVSQVKSGADQLASGATALNDSVPALTQGITQLKDGANALAAGTTSLKDGAGKLYDGTGKLTDGVSELSDGTGKLKNGTSELNSGVYTLTDGIAQLVDGSGQLKDGIIQFNNEGISKLADLVNNDLDGYYERLCAIRDYAKEFTSFTMDEQNEGNSVKFIYKTNSAE
ncbi:MAG: hypothetical protein HUJ56_03630, partial [Erysipelotrichaceae bacterium]|nr:hypothetical protein [Erysipelotrichaceae bacterium]